MMQMRLGCRCLVGAGLLFAACSAASGQQKFFIGTRNLSMGNTGAGASDDALAVHYNPAGMAFQSSWDVQFPLISIDAGLAGDLLARFDQVSDFVDQHIDSLGGLQAIQSRLDGVGGAASEEDLSAMLDLFLYQVTQLDQATQGAVLRGVGGPAFRWKNWGVSLSYLGDGGADSQIELGQGLALSSQDFVTAIPNPTEDCGGDPFCEQFASRLEAAAGGQLDRGRAEHLVAVAGTQLEDSPVAQDLLVNIVEATISKDSTLANNRSGAVATGVAFAQVAFSYSRMVWQDKLSVGGNLKYMTGETYSAFTTLEDLESGQDILEDILDRDQTTMTVSDFGIDLGAMYRPNASWSVGLVGKNLNSPSFELATAGRRGYELSPLLSCGAAWRPLNWFNVAVDLDLNSVDSASIRGLEFQYLSFGAEFLAGRWFAGRVGAYHNMVGDDADPVVTAGVGFGIGRFDLALGGAVSTGSSRLEDDLDIPNSAAVSFSLGWRAGQGAAASSGG